jgi:DNA-binding MarR family transcriptional regulator
MHTRPKGPKPLPLLDFRRDLRVLEREIVRQLAADTDCCGVTMAQCHALLELSLAEVSLSELAAEIDLDASTMSRTVESLVQAGMVERKTNPKDRRALRLTLTAAGRAKVAAIDEKCNGYYGGLLDQMSEEDRRAVVRGVKALAKLMRGHSAAPSCRPGEKCR